MELFLNFIKQLFSAFSSTKAEETSSPNISTQEVSSLDIDDTNSISWKGVVWHHSESIEHPQINDWNGIVKFHTSYRIDGDIVTKEEFEKRKAAGQGKKFTEPWKMVAYHFGIEKIDNKIVLHCGRPLSMYGAHAAVEGVSSEYNKTHIGICLIGNYDLTTLDDEQWQFCLNITRTLMQKFNFSSQEVIGHREVFDKLGVPRQKSCPGKNFDMDLLRAAI